MDCLTALSGFLLESLWGILSGMLGAGLIFAVVGGTIAGTKWIEDWWMNGRVS
jgi:hypothetical protein